MTRRSTTVNSERLAYQRKTDGSYIVVHPRSGEQLGTVRRLGFRTWKAITRGGKLHTTFVCRQSAGCWLLHVARISNNGCDPGCTCAEG